MWCLSIRCRVSQTKENVYIDESAWSKPPLFGRARWDGMGAGPQASLWSPAFAYALAYPMSFFNFSDFQRRGPPSLQLHPTTSLVHVKQAMCIPICPESIFWLCTWRGYERELAGDALFANKPRTDASLKMSAQLFVWASSPSCVVYQWKSLVSWIPGLRSCCQINCFQLHRLQCTATNWSSVSLLILLMYTFRAKIQSIVEVSLTAPATYTKFFTDLHNNAVAEVVKLQFYYDAEDVNPCLNPSLMYLTHCKPTFHTQSMR